MSDALLGERVDDHLDLRAFLAGEAERVEAMLAEIVAGLGFAVPPAIAEPMRYALESRGKRIRPVLCVASYRGLTGTARVADAVYRIASALEVVHTYSLVHDDLPCMDDDDLRRGRPTVHRVFGIHTATLAGAALVPLAAEVLVRGAVELGLEPAEQSRLVRELCRSAGASGIVGGQFLDLQSERRQVGVEEVERIHRSKTGALLTAALRIGALAARADAERMAAVTDYGHALGLAFQIADDILDVTGDSAALGKTAGKDRNVGKATYPALFGLERARELARRRAEDAIVALRRGRIRAPALEALAGFVVERRT